MGWGTLLATTEHTSERGERRRQAIPQVPGVGIGTGPKQELRDLAWVTGG